MFLNVHLVRVIKSRRMRQARHVARMGGGRGVHRVLMGKPEGQCLLGRHSSGREEDIKMDIQEV
jgi:hypothetical protein